MSKLALLGAVAVGVVGVAGVAWFLARDPGPPPSGAPERDGGAVRTGDPGGPATTNAVMDGGKRLVGAVERSWQESEPATPTLGRAPISDAEWPDHPCHQLAGHITGRAPLAPADAKALLRRVRMKLVRNADLDFRTWAFAVCRALERDDPAPCRVPLINVVAVCEEDLNTVRLAQARGSAEACERRLAEVPEADYDARTIAHLCRAATGDGAACDDFPQPDFRWVCEAHHAADAARCELLDDASEADECRALVAVVRAARGQAPQATAELVPTLPLAVVYQKLTDPRFDCDAWYTHQLRELCLPAPPAAMR